MSKDVKVTKESSTGRNEKFQDKAGNSMTRNQFVKEIEKGNYTDYHIRKINRVKTPCSNPDGNSNNNLG